MKFLTEKLDNKEAFQKHLKNWDGTDLVWYMAKAVSPIVLPTITAMARSGLDDYDNYSWWAVREYLRLQKGVYKTTDTLRIVNSLNKLAFAHISAEDPKMVAYTPDRAFGESDRQLRLSISKLLSRLFPIFSDFYIASLTADHDAEVNGTIDFVVGEEIAAVYAEPDAPHSCMKAKGAFRGVMPALAFDMPNIKMAVLRAGNKVTARAMVYENGEDKRYIRNYGDPKLDRRLQRAGYAMSNWHGAEFKIVKIVEQPGEEFDTVDTTPIDPDTFSTHMLATPYLDANGGAGSGYGSNVFLLGGRLRAFASVEQQTAIARLIENEEFRTAFADSEATLYRFSTFPGSEGRTRITNIPERFVQVQCSLTGETLNRLTDSVVTLWHDGSYGETRSAPEFVKVEATAHEMAPASSYYVKPETPTVLKLRTRYRDSKENRVSLGFLQLDPEFYPAEDQDQWHSELIPTKDGKGMLVHDAVWLAVSNDEAKLVHKSAIQKKVHIKLHYNGLRDGYALAELVYKTPHGRKVHPKYNTVHRTFNGYDLPRNVDMSQQVYYLEDIYLFHRDIKKAARKEVYEDFVNRELEALLETEKDLPKLVSRFLQGSSYKTQAPIYTASMPELARLGRVVTPKEVADCNMAELQRACSHWLLQSVMDCELFLKKVLTKIAEANALDYTTNSGTPSTNVSVAIEQTEVQIQTSEACHV